MKKRTVIVFVLAATSLVASSAHAAPTAQERALAESLFQDAKALVTAGNVASACPKFAESQRLDPQVGTLLYLATCHQQEGKTASSWVEFNDAASAAHAASQPDREAIARSRAAALEPKLARLTVRVGTPSEGEELTLDGIPLKASAWGTAFPVDPGAHVVNARAPGREPLARNIIAEPSRTITVEIPELGSAATAAQPHDAAPAPAPAEEHGHRTLAFVALGIGGAGIVAGSIYGLIAIVDKNDASKLGDGGACVGNRCTQPVLDKESAARTNAWMSTASFAIGAVATGAGAYLLFTSGSGKDTSKATWVIPRVGPHEAGLGGGFSF